MNYIIGLFLLLCVSIPSQAADIKVYIAGGSHNSDTLIANELLHVTPTSTNSHNFSSVYDKLTLDTNAVAVLNDHALLSILLSRDPKILSKIKVIASVGYDEWYLVKLKNAPVRDVFGGWGGRSLCRQMVSEYTRKEGLYEYKYLPYVNQSQKNLDILSGKVIGCVPKNAVQTASNTEVVYQFEYPDSRLYKFIISNPNISVDAEQYVRDNIASNISNRSTQSEFSSHGFVLDVNTGAALTALIQQRTTFFNQLNDNGK